MRPVRPLHRPIEVVVLNCWVTETNDTLCSSNSSTSLGEVHQRAGQTPNLVKITSILPARTSSRSRKPRYRPACAAALPLMRTESEGAAALPAV
jgi:hypothetical protein